MFGEVAVSKSEAKWELVQSATVYDGRRFKVKNDAVLLPNGFTTEYTYIDKSPAVMVVPVINENQLLMVRQYRYIVNVFSWEFPAGGILSGETPEEAAYRELLEETGYSAERLVPMSKVFTSNGNSNEHVYLYAAYDLHNVGQELEITEFDMLVKPFAISKCFEMVKQGVITCAGTILSLLYFQFFLNN